MRTGMRPSLLRTIHRSQGRQSLPPSSTNSCPVVIAGPRTMLLAQRTTRRREWPSRTGRAMEWERRGRFLDLRSQARCRRHRPDTACTANPATSAKPLAPDRTVRPWRSQNVDPTVAGWPSRQRSARMPVACTARTMSASGGPPTFLDTIILPLRMSNARCPSPPTTGPTACFRTATSSAQSIP